MSTRTTKNSLAISLILSGILILLTQVLLPNLAPWGPMLRYGLLSPGATQEAADQLGREVQVIGDRIGERQAIDGAPTVDETLQFLWPTPGWGEITSTWGNRLHPVLGLRKAHLGIDIGASTGAEVLAIQAGEVILADHFSAYGQLLVIDHGSGWASVYAHLSELEVNEGDWVEAGQVIGAVGATGRVTGPHLHLELHRQGEPVDPLNYVVVP